MKIQKGKLSTSNALVIGILVIALYFVMPASKSRKTTSQSNSTASELSAADHSVQDSSVSNAAEPVNNSLDSTQRVIATQAASAVPVLKGCSPLDEEDLNLLKDQNPFFTKAMIAQAESQRTIDEPQQAPPAENGDVPTEDLASTPKISLIYQSTTGKKAAVIDNKVVYNGTVIRGDVTVMSISEQGVQLSHITSASSE